MKKPTITQNWNIIHAIQAPDALTMHKWAGEAIQYFHHKIEPCTSKNMLDNSSLSSTLATLGFSELGSMNFTTNDSR